MKRAKNLITIGLFAATALAAQNPIQLKFTANHNGKYIQLDSIRVDNITKNQTQTFLYPDTILTLSSTVGTRDINGDGFSLTHSSANPIDNNTGVALKLPQAGKVNITLRNTLGQPLASFCETLNVGIHSFTIATGSEHIYYVTATSNNASQTVKLLNNGKASQKTTISYNGNIAPFPVLKSASTAAQTQTLGFSAGDSLRFIGYHSKGRLYTDTIAQKPASSQTHTFNTQWRYINNPIGGIDKVYSTFYYDGSFQRMDPWIMNLRADDMVSKSAWSNPNDIEQYKLDATNDMFYWFPWMTYYNGILFANEVLEYVPQIEMDSDLKSRILGEAKFLRGLFYYQLLLMYKDIPLVTKLPTELPQFSPLQANRSAVWQQVISDFTEAMAALPYKSAYTGTDIGRATKGAAAGFLGKTYMINKEYALAQNVLQQVIDMGQYALMPNYRDNFTSQNENNSESLFEVQFSVVPNTSKEFYAFEADTIIDKSSAKAVAFAPTPFGFGDTAPSDWIINLFLEEKTNDGAIDPRMSASFFWNQDGTTFYGKTWGDTYGSQTGYKNRKYLNDETATTETYQSGINDRLLRYADILLLQAEALNELGMPQQALQYIKAVRDRSNLPQLSGSLTQSEIRERIVRERALEFYLEGNRIVDLLRWGYFEDADKLAILKSHDANYNNYQTGREYLAVPPSILKQNANLVQSAGW